MKKNIAIFVLSLLVFTGCSSKDVVKEYNKSAIYWYQKMVESASSGNLDKADDYFSSLQSEHISSILLKEAMLILAQAHMNEEEYLLADYYIDEHIKRFSDSKGREYAQFLKMKAKFLAFKHPRREQKLLDETIEVGKNFKAMYPNSIYTAEVDTMLSRLGLGKESLNQEIASLYERIGYTEAAKFYEAKVARGTMNFDNIVPAYQWWVRSLFE